MVIHQRLMELSVREVGVVLDPKVSKNVAEMGLALELSLGEIIRSNLMDWVGNEGLDLIKHVGHRALCHSDGSFKMNEVGLCRAVMVMFVVGCRNRAVMAVVPMMEYTEQSRGVV